MPDVKCERCGGFWCWPQPKDERRLADERCGDCGGLLQQLAYGAPPGAMTWPLGATLASRLSFCRRHLRPRAWGQSPPHAPCRYRDEIERIKRVARRFARPATPQPTEAQR